jgi:hypothetical protein
VLRVALAIALAATVRVAVPDAAVAAVLMVLVALLAIGAIAACVGLFGRQRRAPGR